MLSCEANAPHSPAAVPCRTGLMAARWQTEPLGAGHSYADCSCVVLPVACWESESDSTTGSKLPA